MHATCALIIVSVSVDLTVAGKERYFDQELKRGGFEEFEITDLFGRDSVREDYTF